MSVSEFLGYLYDHEASRDLTWQFLGALRTQRALATYADGGSDGE